MPIFTSSWSIIDYLVGLLLIIFLAALVIKQISTYLWFWWSDLNFLWVNSIKNNISRRSKCVFEFIDESTNSLFSQYFFFGAIKDMWLIFKLRYPIPMCIQYTTYLSVCHATTKDIYIFLKVKLFYN